MLAGAVSDEARKLCEVTREALNAAIKVRGRDGQRFGAESKAYVCVCSVFGMRRGFLRQV